MADGRSDTAKLDDHDRVHGVGECNEGSCNPETAHEDDDCCADEECEAADPCVDDDCHSDGQTVSNDDDVILHSEATTCCGSVEQCDEKCIYTAAALECARACHGDDGDGGKTMTLEDSTLLAPVFC